MDKQDIKFFQILSGRYPKINLVYQPDGVVNGIRSINAFYKQCREAGTIYFRLDDDIVWMEPDIIEKMVRFRIDNPDYFLVSPLVINNAICTYILQNAGKIRLNKYYHANANDQTLWGNGEFAAQLHEWFLNTQIADKQYEKLYCGKRPIALNRFSINVILWFGSEMDKFGGIVPYFDDEEWMSIIKPTELGAANGINGDAIVSHFAFYPQRKALDKLNILGRYGTFLRQEWKKNPVMSEIDKTVQEAMREVERRKEELLKEPGIYPDSRRKKEKLIRRIANWKALPGLKLYPLWQIGHCFKRREKYIR
jgi:hypothetical protein